MKGTGNIMKKQKVLLIVVLVVAIAMVGFYIALGLMGDKAQKTGEDLKTVQMLTDMDDVTYVQYKNAKGTVTLTKTDNTWKCEENAELVLADGYTRETATELGRIEGELVTDAVKADCGLDKPVYALTVKNAEKEVKLVFGVSEDGVCYAMLDGKNDIYEIDEDIINILNLNADAFSVPDGSTPSSFENLEEDEPLVEEVGEDVVSEDTTTEDTTVEDISPEDTTEE